MHKAGTKCMLAAVYIAVCCITTELHTDIIYLNKVVFQTQVVTVQICVNDYAEQNLRDICPRVTYHIISNYMSVVSKGAEALVFKTPTHIIYMYNVHTGLSRQVYHPSPFLLMNTLNLRTQFQTV